MVVYQGTYEQYQALPWNIKQYYTAPPLAGERQIRTVYQQAPMIWHTPTPEEPYAYVRQPTPIQEQRIIETAKQLPPEARKKYIVEPKPPPTWKELTATGAIMEKGYVWRTGARLHMGPKIYEMTPEQKKRVLARTVGIREIGAGFVSVPEQWGGFIGRPTPPGPVSGVIGWAIGQPKAWEEYVETPALYKVGQVPAMVFESALIGVGVGKAAQLVKKIPYVAKTTARVSQAYRLSRVAKVAHKARLTYIKYKPWVSKAKYVSKGEVAIPPAIQPLTLKQLKASQVAWELTRVPRTGGVWLSRVGVAPPKARVLPHLISRAGKVSIGYLRELGYYEEPIWKRGLLPFVTQKQVTRLGLVPYIPKVAVSTGKKAFSTFGLGLAVTTVAKSITVPRLVAPQVPRIKRREPLITLPKVWPPTLAREREKFRPLTILEPKVKQRERLMPMVKLPQALIQPQLPKLEQLPKTLQRQRQALVPKIPTPQIPKFPPFPPLIRLGGGARGRAADRRRFAKWWRKQQKIKTPRQMLKTYSDKTLKKVMGVF